MDRYTSRYSVERKRECRPISAVACCLAGFLLVAVLVVPGPALSADWLAPAADQTVTANWVKDITAQLDREPYRDVFVNALGYSPQAAVVRYLNHAAQALQAGNKPLAQSYVDRSIALFDNGVRRGYYSQIEVEPIKTMIRTRAEAAIKGQPMAAGTEADARWTGYTEKKELGLTNEMSQTSRMTTQHPDPKKMN